MMFSDHGAREISLRAGAKSLSLGSSVPNVLTSNDSHTTRSLAQMAESRTCSVLPTATSVPRGQLLARRCVSRPKDCFGEPADSRTTRGTFGRFRVLRSRRVMCRRLGAAKRRKNLRIHQLPKKLNLTWNRWCVVTFDIDSPSFDKSFDFD